MSFDKTKAMRNADRFLSQGKIRAAISEYQRVVESDPRDYSTLNILGDLYAKGNETEEAVNCFKQVADHYSKQGFAQKAIAVYNKISRLDPNSIEVSEKLAHLYQSRGSYAEARSHYVSLAEQYQKRGKKAEALEIWKQIAKLDPNNTEVYLKVAEFCVQNGQKDEATKAYTEAGLRFAAADQTESALTAFSRALEIRQYDLAALNGYVKAQIKLGFADDAAQRLEKILEQSPYNREILYLLVDCHLDSGNLAEAELAVVRLVEQEPANYPKFIDLVARYIESGDLESASRILSMSSEHLLVGGKHEEFQKWANEIVARDPEQLDALRLLVRYYGWQRDEKELRTSLERLAEIARMHDAVDDEKYALSQLVLIVPHEVSFARRLQEIKIEQGDISVNEPPPIITPQREPAPNFSDFVAQEYEPASAFSSASNGFDLDAYTGVANGNGFEPTAIQVTEADVSVDFGNSGLEFSPAAEAQEFENEDTPNALQPAVPRELSPSEEMRLSQEIESIDFYIAQGYKELADRSISALEAEFGVRPEFDALRARIENPEPEAPAEPMSIFDDPVPATTVPTVSTVAETPSTMVVQPVPEPAPQPTAPEPERPRGATSFDMTASNDFLNDFRAELGLEDAKAQEDDDFETVFQTAIAYKEMGLLEDSIRGFQDAVNRVKPDDGTSRFFNCCNLLGHCFMDKGMPNLGIMWFKRALEATTLTNEERNAMLYELGNAYSVAGDLAKAIESFEQIYAFNVDYRDVSKRLEALYVPAR